MSPVIRKILRSSLLLVALAFVVILAGILPINAGFVRGSVENAVRDAIGMELSIGGPVKIRLGPWPEVTTGDLRLGNASDDPLLLVESLRVKIELGALLRGRIHVLEVETRGIAIDYCSPFPEFPDKSTESTPPPSVAINDITVTQVSVRCGPSPGADPLEISLKRVNGTAPQDASIQASAAGSFSGMPFELTLTGGELNDLLAAAGAFPVSATLSSDAAAAEASGHLVMAPPGPSVEIQLVMRAANVRALAENFDVELPDLGSLDVGGSLRGDLETIALVDFEGNLGTSRFKLDTTLNIAGERPRAEFTAMLDPLDVAPFLDTDSDPEQSSPSPGDDDVDFSAILDSLDLIDADLRVDVRKVLGLPIEINDAELRGQITDGVVTLQSMGAALLGGQAAIDGSLDSRVDCPELELRARLSDLEFATEDLGGRAGKVNLDTTSCGRSLSAHRKSLHAAAELIDARAQLGGEPVPLSARRLNLDIKPGQQSRAHFVGDLAGEQVEATLTVGSLEALLGSDTWPMRLDARGSGSHMRVEGRARLLPQPLVADALLRFDAPAFGTLHTWTGAATDALAPLRAEAKLGFDESRIVADGISVQLGKSDVSGRLVWQYAQNPDLMSLTVRSNSVDVAELASLFSPATEPVATTHTPAESADAPRAFVLPPVDLDLAIDAIHADRLDIQDLTLGARLRKGLIDDARVSLVLEDEIHFRGGLDLDVRQLPARGRLDFSAENVDIGRVLRRLEVSDDVRMLADKLELRVTSEGTSPVQFATNLLLEAKLQDFDWKIPRRFSGGQEDNVETFDVTLANVELATAPNQSTTWSSAGTVDGMQIEVWMEAPPLHELFDDTAELPISLVAAANNDVARFDVRIDRSTEEALRAHLMLSGEVVPIEGRELSQLGSPLEDYQLQSNFILTENHLQLPDVQLLMGTSTAEGRFDMDSTGPRTQFDVALHAPYLQTDDLLYWSDNFREGLLGDGAQNADEQIADDAEDRNLVLLARNFLANFRKNNDVDFNITVDELHAGSDLLGGGEIHMRIDENDFLLKPLSIRLPGGGVNAEYVARVSDGRLDANLRVNADAMLYAGLLRLVDHESTAAGILYIDADISANTEWTPGSVSLDMLFENAGGSIAFAAWPEDFSAGLLDLWSANLVLAMLPKSEDSETSRLNCLVSRFDIESGLMKSKVTLLDTTDSVIRGRGTISLAEEQFDLVVWPQAKREKFLSVSAPVAITGSFDDIEVGVVPAGFIGTLIKWYTSLIYVPFKWLTGERFPADGTATCFDAMDWELTPELNEYFLKRDFGAPPVVQ